ncbi:hypothetical protein OSTOST_19086 [Ostertagia ostertagi]
MAPPRQRKHVNPPVQLVGPQPAAGINMSFCPTNSRDASTFIQSTLTVIEYAIVKTPLMTLIITSFLFSFTRICHDFPFNSVMYFFHPLILYVVVFYSELVGKWRRFRKSFGEWCRGDIDIAQWIKDIVPDGSVNLFLQYKTSLGVPQKVLVDEAWESELCIVVALTAFSLYITYLMPLNYLDLLHRSAVHLGTWDQIEGPKIGQTGQAKYALLDRLITLLPYQCSQRLISSWAPMPWVAQCLYSDGETVQLPDGRCYRARGSSALKTVAAEPGCPEHDKFFMLCGRPCTLINGMCIFEGALIVTQFWMLVLTTDWQHIVTLVLLMFANYLLLAKLFKDKDLSVASKVAFKCVHCCYICVPRSNLMEGVPPLSWIAHPVRVQLVTGGTDQSVDGNLYTVDPVTGSLVIVRFRNEKPCQVSWIPREGYISVSMIEESSPHCQQYSVELADMMSNIRKRLLSWLRANHVDVKECDDGSLLIFGAARIQSRSLRTVAIVIVLLF